MPPEFYLRDFTAQDYPHLVDIHNANYPLRLRRADALIEADRTRSPKCRARRWVACEAGCVVGFGAYYQDIGDYHPQRFYVTFAVLPEFHRRGIGAALYDQVMTALQIFDPRVLRVDAYSTHLHGLRFLEKRGFHEAWRETPVQLDVAAFDPAPYASLEGKLRAGGFEIKTLRDLESDPNRYRKLYHLSCLIEKTLPREESEVTPMDFEDWASMVMDEKRLPPDAYFVAR